MRLALGSLLVALLAADAQASDRPPICPDARYVVEAELPDDASGRFLVRIEDDRVFFETFCTGRHWGRIRRTRRGPRLRARLRGCESLGRSVRVAATVTDGCETFAGAMQVDGKRPRRRTLRATRSRCGDGVVDGGNGETCDGAGGCVEGHACGEQCVCTALPTTTTTTLAVCGDGVRSGSEACDGLDRGDHTCTSAGFDGGALGCTAACELDTSSCCACGNDVIEAACGEQCDGTALGDGACGKGGPISCLSSCLGWNFNACHRCGNGVREGFEECDDDDLGGTTCPQGSSGGAPVCTAHCELDSAPCIQCGDGELEAGEACDDGNLESGDGCSSTCVIECGDGLVQPPDQCDDGNLVLGDGCSEFCTIEGGFSGGGGENAEWCALQWGAARTPQDAPPVHCQDGAPSCDQGPAGDGACRFLAYFCLNNPASSGPCSWTGPARVELLAGGEHALDATAQETVLAAFEHTLERWGGLTLVRDGLALEVTSPSLEALCGQFLLDVPAGETRRVPIAISDHGAPAAVDVDSVDFVCDQ